MHANLLIAAQKSALDKLDLPILDAGCGTGGLLSRLAAEYCGSPVVGLDLDRLACTRAAIKSGRPVCAGSINDLPFADDALAAIFSADVLCHEGVDERRALRQFYRCLDSERLAHPQSTRLSLDAVAARCSSEQYSALYRDGSSPFANGGRVPSGVHLLLERCAAPADGYRAQTCSSRSWSDQRRQAVPELGRNALPSRDGARKRTTAPRRQITFRRLNSRHRGKGRRRC